MKTRNVSTEDVITYSGQGQLNTIPDRDGIHLTLPHRESQTFADHFNVEKRKKTCQQYLSRFKITSCVQHRENHLQLDTGIAERSLMN